MLLHMQRAGGTTEFHVNVKLVVSISRIFVGGFDTGGRLLPQARRTLVIINSSSSSSQKPEKSATEKRAGYVLEIPVQPRGRDVHTPRQGLLFLLNTF